MNFPDELVAAVRCVEAESGWPEWRPHQVAHRRPPERAIYSSWFKFPPPQYLESAARFAREEAFRFHCNWARAPTARRIKNLSKAIVRARLYARELRKLRGLEPIDADLPFDCELGVSGSATATKAELPTVVSATMQSACRHVRRAKNGKTTAGSPRFYCRDCGKNFTESTIELQGMRIGLETAEVIRGSLAAGASFRLAAKVAGVHRNTVAKLVQLDAQRQEAQEKNSAR